MFIMSPRICVPEEQTTHLRFSQLYGLTQADILFI